MEQSSGIGQGSIRLAERPNPVLFGRASLELLQTCTDEKLAERVAADKVGCGTHTITHSWNSGGRAAARVQAPSQPGDTWEFRAWCTTGPGKAPSYGSLYIFSTNDQGETPNQHPNGTSGWNGTANGGKWWINARMDACDAEWRQLRVRYTMPYYSTTVGAPDPTGWVAREWGLHQWSGVQVRLDHRGSAEHAGVRGNPIFWDGFELRKLYRAPESCCSYSVWGRPRGDVDLATGATPGYHVPKKPSQEESCPPSC